MKKILILSLGLLGTLSMQAMEEEEVLLSGEKKKKESQPIFFKKFSRLWTRAEKKLDESPYLENQKEGIPLIFFNIKNETGKPLTILKQGSRETIKPDETAHWVPDLNWKNSFGSAFLMATLELNFAGKKQSDTIYFYYISDPSKSDLTVSGDAQIIKAEYENTFTNYPRYRVTLTMKSDILQDARLTIEEK